MRVSAEERFAIVPEWVLFADISAQAIRLYAVLARYADQSNRANPSRRAIAERMHCSRDTVDRALRELQAIGAVQVVPQISEHGDPTSNLYVLAVRPPSRMDAPTPPQECGDGGRTDAGRGGRTDAALNDNQSERELHEREIYTPAALAAPRPRSRDQLFEAVVEVCYGVPHDQLTDTERSRVNRAVAELRKVSATPEDVFSRAVEYRARSPDYPLMPQTLTKYWTDLAIPRGGSRDHHRSRTPNGRAASDSGRARYATEAEEIDYRPVYRPRIAADPPG